MFCMRYTKNNDSIYLLLLLKKCLRRHGICYTRTSLLLIIKNGNDRYRVSFIRNNLPRQSRGIDDIVEGGR